jgi:metallophosphoesterase superfamily enzyme
MRVLDDWLLTPERMAIHLPSQTAVAADLHLGYNEARRRAGEAVPADALDEQLAGLRRALVRHGVGRLVLAGDVLEEPGCRAALARLSAWLDEARIEAVLVPGNHDAVGLEAEFPICPEGAVLGEWRVVHGDGLLPSGPLVHGHEHPWVRWRGRGKDGLAPGAPCYLVGEQRLILPAFSTDAAGVSVFSVRRWRSWRCCVIAGDRVLDLGTVAGLRGLLSGRAAVEIEDGTRP